MLERKDATLGNGLHDNKKGVNLPLWDATMCMPFPFPQIWTIHLLSIHFSVLPSRQRDGKVWNDFVEMVMFMKMHWALCSEHSFLTCNMSIS